LDLESLPDIEELAEGFIASLPCRDQSPYPPVEVTEPNRRYAELLLDAYADGSSAELTAITQYVHHYLTIDVRPVAQLELCIALVEMLHLEFIGELIRLLGLDPRFYRSNFHWWSGGVVAYDGDVCHKLRLDINAELAAVREYERLIIEIEDPKVQRVLRRIVDDEQVHLRLFQAALERYCGDG